MNSAKESAHPATNAFGLAYRPDIEGVRGIAILLVVAAHAEFSWFAGGFVGVDVFFVMSGYLITALLFQELRQSGGAEAMGILCPAFTTLAAGAPFYADVHVASDVDPAGALRTTQPD